MTTFIRQLFVKFQEVITHILGQLLSIRNRIDVIRMWFLANESGRNSKKRLCWFNVFKKFIPISFSFKVNNEAQVTWIFSYIFSMFLIYLHLLYGQDSYCTNPLKNKWGLGNVTVCTFYLRTLIFSYYYWDYYNTWVDIQYIFVHYHWELK